MKKKLLLLTVVLFISLGLSAQHLDKEQIVLLSELLDVIQISDSDKSQIAPAVDQLARDVFINHSIVWDKKNRWNLLNVSKSLEISSLMEVACVARYDQYPKVSKLAWNIFYDKLDLSIIPMETTLFRQVIDTELPAVYTAPWPVAHTLFKYYRSWVILEDIQKIFDSATVTNIFSADMFDLAVYVAIKSLDAHNDQYKGIVRILARSYMYQPRLADKAIHKIEKHYFNVMRWY